MKTNKKSAIFRRIFGAATALTILFTFNQCVKQFDKVKNVEVAPVQIPDDEIHSVVDDEEESDLTPENEQEQGGTEVARTAASVGVLNFEQVDASFSTITGIDRRMYADVNSAFVNNFLGLPGRNSVKEYNASHTMAVFKVASAYCSRLSQVAAARTAFYEGVININQAPNSVLSTPAQKMSFIDGMVGRVWGQGVDEGEMLIQTKQELLLLLDDLLEGENMGNVNTTRAVSVGVCAAMLSAPQVIYL